MEQLLLDLNIANPDPEDLAAIFRAAHSIKGGAATFGFIALTEKRPTFSNRCSTAHATTNSCCART
ncbi:MAG: Signal transduction histidine kinase CheA [uncultured Paraburkholderia sp.]|nr:MAG: Signal transduction histidine kinase CheA [uncultured Paraburkholderia sp.]CAH2917890.1 MAG: Signal transduction histidine kinase CheA [uncultured Paraburkholderia sp.]